MRFENGYLKRPSYGRRTIEQQELLAIHPFFDGALWFDTLSFIFRQASFRLIPIDM